jgi:hypothetical protein
MTPYWPSPLGATRRRLAPKQEVQTFLFSTEFFRSRKPASSSFPKRNSGCAWVSENELPARADFEADAEGLSPGLG